MSVELKVPSRALTNTGFSRKRIKTGKKSYANKSYVQRAVPAAGKALLEMKSVDTQGSLVFATSNNFYLVNALLPGANAYQRAGRKVNMMRIHVTGWVYQYQAGVAPTVDYLRLLLVYDKQADGANPTLGNLLADVDSTGAVTTNSRSGINLDNSDRFIILRDLRYKVEVPSGAVAANQPAQVSTMTNSKWSFNEYIKCDLPVIYGATANAGTIADIQSGSLFMVAVGLNAAAASQYATQFHVRVRFADP